MIFLIVLFAVILLLLMIIDAPKTVIVMVMLPLSVGIVISGVKSQFMQGLTLNILWLPVTAFMFAGVLLAFVFWKIIS